MDLACSNEKEFVRNAISYGTRIDLRGFHEIRQIKISDSTNEQADGYIRLGNGETEIEIFIRIFETEKTLIKLDISANELKKYKDASKSIEKEIEVNLMLPIEKYFIPILKKYKIGIKIELNLIKDGGNSYDLLFYGISKIFKCISIPLIENIKEEIKEIRESIDIPYSQTYAIFGDEYLSDPNKLEEQSCDCLVHIFYDQSKAQICGMEINYKRNYKLETLLKIINKGC
ncbi:Exosome complex component Rrp42 [Astathelohania contejeani]|uniref:Ribosomal RNA-processing protein 42 n=1 Tax=Astathelohania contejeani TaxID=164912 RepID=A0ABQ7I039_9MICR|nr:Exosome complex component Rrp42 [Thelohania contejeani]